MSLDKSSLTLEINLSFGIKMKIWKVIQSNSAFTADNPLRTKFMRWILYTYVQVSMKWKNKKSRMSFVQKEITKWNIKLPLHTVLMLFALLAIRRLMFKKDFTIAMPVIALQTIIFNVLKIVVWLIVLLIKIKNAQNAEKAYK